MKRSESIANLAAALADAQIEMTSAQMDATNPHFKSKYATLASVIEALKPIHQRGLALIQTASVDRHETGALVTVETTLAHKSGEWIAETISLKPVSDNPQAVGSAITYGRRYLAAAVVGIAADDDDDANGATKPQQQQKPAVKPLKPIAKPEPQLPVTTCPDCKGGKNPTQSVCGSCERKAEEEARAKAAEKPAEGASVRMAASSAQVAAEIKEARNMFVQMGVKTTDALKQSLVSILGYEVTGSLTALSNDERAKVLAELRRMATTEEKAAANG